jgi:hypothetical protein
VWCLMPCLRPISQNSHLNVKDAVFDSDVFQAKILEQLNCTMFFIFHIIVCRRCPTVISVLALLRLDASSSGTDERAVI